MIIQLATSLIAAAAFAGAPSDSVPLYTNLLAMYRDALY